MVVEELTKKEQIINLAQNDPFLKISDIAEYVKTTPRYVRTILSEANISLMQLRKRYARSMERRLKVREGGGYQALVKIISGDGEIRLGEVRVEEVEEELSFFDFDDNLFRLLQTRYRGEKPYCLHELITAGQNFVFKGQNDEKPLYSLLEVKEKDLSFRSSVIRVERADRLWRNELLLQEDEPVLMVERDVLQGKDTVAREKFILDAEIIEFILQGELVI